LSYLVTSGASHGRERAERRYDGLADCKPVREIETRIEIDAPPAAVWRVLTDFPAYGKWNPFITSIAGTVREGEQLTVRLEPPGGKGMTIKPTVLAAEPERELRWKGRLVVPGLFDGEHSFRIEPVGGQRSRFVHVERFTGILVGLVKGVLAKTEAGFEQMNAALKRQVEESR
jgi:hypothetical protein